MKWGASQWTLSRLLQSAIQHVPLTEAYITVIEIWF